ncbi:putative membrane protein [Paenibacillus rhizosphaerae]|uniref:Putative membrane protein n=1 Tax=Paenibacillus rhizosphaerae TaxID=297318 RepID=A0A839TM81_9BACL|nr:putative membrane protein [Paenibacillus rhizosphaerae]
MENSSVYVFSALFCIALLCFLAVRIYSIRHKSGNRSREDNIDWILKNRMAKGEIDKQEYIRLKDLLSK